MPSHGSPREGRRDGGRGDKSHLVDHISLLRPPYHGCQMAIAKFLDCMPSGFWTMALYLHYAAKFDPFLSEDCAPRPPPPHNPRKGRDQKFCHLATMIPPFLPPSILPSRILWSEPRVRLVDPGCVPERRRAVSDAAAAAAVVSLSFPACRVCSHLRYNVPFLFTI